MEFVVRSPRNRPNVVEVRYDCECGCKPRARYEQGTTEAGHEHCCCGRVHFVGDQATQHLEAYLAERRASGEDVDLQYTVQEQVVTAPWGDPIPVAFGVPDKLHEH